MSSVSRTWVTKLSSLCPISLNLNLEEQQRAYPYSKEASPAVSLHAFRIDTLLTQVLDQFHSLNKFSLISLFLVETEEKVLAGNI